MVSRESKRCGEDIGHLVVGLGACGGVFQWTPRGDSTFDNSRPGEQHNAVR
jgi:hypothetical protein